MVTASEVTEPMGVAAIAVSPRAGDAAAKRPLSAATLLIFASSGVPGAVLTDMLGTFLPRFYARIGLSMLVVGSTFALVRLLDSLFIDLALGWAMDHTRTRIGRYRPWFIAGAPILMVGIYMLFNPPAHIQQSYLFIWYLWLGIGMSIVGLSQSAWAANLAPSYHDRSRLFSWMISVAVLCAMPVNALPALTHGKIQPAEASGIHLIGWALLGLLVVTTALVGAVTPEPVAPNVQRGKVVWSDYLHIVARPIAGRLIFADFCLVMAPALTRPIQLFLFHDVKHLSLTAATTLLVFHNIGAILGAPLWAQVAKRLGKHRTLQVSIGCYAVCQTGLVLVPAGQFPAMAAVMVLAGISMSTFLFMVRAMLADYGDQLRLEQGVSRVSLLYSLVSVTQKVGTSLNVFLTFSALSLVGFNAAQSAKNSPQALVGLEVIYLAAPIALAVLAGLALIGYDLGEKRHAEIRAALAERDADPRQAEIIAGVGDG
jgi:Na+/melibiose symporter-like transporter